jgi:hypothetical protein
MPPAIPIHTYQTVPVTFVHSLIPHTLTRFDPSPAPTRLFDSVQSTRTTTTITMA